MSQTETSPADGVVTAFASLRERCRHYQGIKIELDDKQCTHPDQNGIGDWCALEHCPYVITEARRRSVGFD